MWPQAAAVVIPWRELTSLHSSTVPRCLDNGVTGRRDALNPRASTQMFASWYVLMRSQQRSKELLTVEQLATRQLDPSLGVLTGRRRKPRVFLSWDDEHNTDARREALIRGGRRRLGLGDTSRKDNSGCLSPPPAWCVTIYAV